MTKDQRREAMPECTAFLDGMREIFGAPTYIKASENGHEVEWGTDVEGIAVQPVEG